MTDTLISGTALAEGQSLTAAHGWAELAMQADGNLVLYCTRPGGRVARWATGTNGKAVDNATMLAKGHLALLKGPNQVWCSPGQDAAGAHLLVQDDENVVIYTIANTPVWASNTSLDGTPIQGSGPTVWFLYQGVRHPIPDPETLTAKYGGWDAVAHLSDDQVNLWPEGDPEPSVHPVDLAALTMCHDILASGPAHPPRTVPPPPPKIMPDGSLVGVAQQPLTGQTDKMWNVGYTLRVKLNGGSPFVRGKVRQFAEVWKQYANIDFAWVDPGQAADIHVTFQPGKGSWSMVGRDAQWALFDIPTMNFGWFNDQTDDAGFGTVTHEFGHALGLVHEHQSPAAGIAWDREKAYAYYMQTQNWTRDQVDANVFNRYSVTETNYSQFDPLSIMEYPIPASITLDGYSVGWNTVLSETDKTYIARWYPRLPTPATAQGLLRTGDDCDEIDFQVDYDVEDPATVGFSLTPGPGLTWWKAIQVPIGGSGYRMFQMQDGRNATGTIPQAQIDAARPLRFWKAKLFGVHTQLGYTWDVLTALPGGSRLSLLWKRDHC